MQFTKINKSRHSAYVCTYIFVYHQVSKADIGDLHHASFGQCAAEVCRDFGAELKECDGEADHVHMLIEYAPTVQLSVLVNSLKAVTSRRLRNEFLDLRGALQQTRTLVTLLLCGLLRRSTVGGDQQYIQNQRG